MHPFRLLLTLLLTTAAVGFAGWLILDAGSAPAPSRAAQPRQVVATGTGGAGEVGNVPRGVSTLGGPIRLEYPVLAIDAPVREFTPPLDGSALPAPDQPEVVGWYRAPIASREGEHGLLVGHVSWRDGSQAVFERLDEAAPGDRFTLHDGDALREYRVVSVRHVDAFATSLDEVTGRGDAETLTLITCSGTYLWDVQMYDQRTVVLAERVWSEEPRAAPEAANALG